MDARDFLILGGVAVAGYFGWRWWKGAIVTNAAQSAPGTAVGNAASSMTETGARTTVFGGVFGTRRLLMPPPRDPVPTAVAGTAPASMSPDFATNPTMRVGVLHAVLGNQPVAPSPSNNRFTGPLGIRAGVGTRPLGDPPQPADPAPTWFSLRGIG
jgi:hypothetical protein